MSSFVFEAPIAVLCLIRKGKAPLELQISFAYGGALQKAPRQQEVRESCNLPNMKHDYLPLAVLIRINQKAGAPYPCKTK